MSRGKQNNSQRFLENENMSRRGMTDKCEISKIILNFKGALDVLSM